MGINPLKLSSKSNFFTPDTIYKEYAVGLRDHAEKLTGDAGLEIVHDVFNKLFNDPEKMTSITNMKAFLHTAVRNACLDYLDKEKRREARHKVYAQWLNNQRCVASFESEKSIFQTDQFEKILDLVPNLKGNQKKVIVAYFVEDQSTEEIAQAMSITPATVRNLRNLGLNRLRELNKTKVLQVIAGLTILLWVTFHYLVSQGRP